MATARNHPQEMNTRFLAGLVLLFEAGLPAREVGLRPWNDYRTILWMSGAMEKHRDRQALIFERLRELGINTAMTGRDGDPRPFIEAGFGYYVENVVNKGLCLKFNSSVTNWSGFIDEWMKTRDEKAFVRDYCLDDPAWRESVFDVMRKAAGHHAPFAPLAYDLRDELSVTISANPFDYDFSPPALAGFRGWLRTQYATLERLNERWETDFPSWEAVRPFSTDRIKARMATGARMPAAPPDWNALKKLKFDPVEAAKTPTRWNFSPWCDHRTYMDISLARTLDDLRTEARKHDSHTPVGIEGAQMAHAFGGYDLWRLSQAVDWMEPYDVCNSREILGSFMPGKPLLSTVFEKETPAAQRRLWHLLLLGDRGCIIWWSEDVIDWTRADLPLSDKGRALAPVLKQMTSPLANLFLLAEKQYDPIAIHYSQPSIQVAWLLESTVDGKTWPRRFSSFEATHNRQAQVRNGALKVLQDNGWTPRFLADEQIAAGALEAHQIKIVVTAGDWAVGNRVDTAIQHWAQRAGGKGGWVLLQTGAYGLFNEHGRFKGTQTPRNPLDNAPVDPPTVLVFAADSPAGIEMPGNMMQYPANRLEGTVEPALSREIAEMMARRGARPAVRTPASARVLIHRYKLGGARLVAFERNIEWKMSEDLKQAGGNQELEKPDTFAADWDEAAEVVDLWTGKRLGRTNRIEVHLDPWKPALFALLPAPLEGDVVEALLKAARP